MFEFVCPFLKGRFLNRWVFKMYIAIIAQFWSTKLNFSVLQYHENLKLQGVETSQHLSMMKTLMAYSTH